MKKQNNTLLITLAIIAAVLAAFNAYVALQQVSDLARVTGFQVFSSTSVGNVTLSIPQNVQVEFNPAIINWSNGSFDAGVDMAVLKTSNTLSERVQNGTWWNGAGQGRDTGLVLINRGNINVSVNLTTFRNNFTFFQPTVGIGRALYDLNISSNATLGVPETACGVVWQSANFNVFTTAKNATEGGIIICRNMSYIAGQNALRIDVLLRIPVGVQRREYADTVTATADVASI